MSEADLLPGWTREVRTSASGRSYPIYRGPAGEYAESKKQMLRGGRYPPSKLSAAEPQQKCYTPALASDSSAGSSERQRYTRAAAPAGLPAASSFMDGHQQMGDDDEAYVIRQRRWWRASEWDAVAERPTEPTTVVPESQRCYLHLKPTPQGNYGGAAPVKGTDPHPCAPRGVRTAGFDGALWIARTPLTCSCRPSVGRPVLHASWPAVRPLCRARQVHARSPAAAQPRTATQEASRSEGGRLGVSRPGGDAP
jgi:hypothetical protein